MKYYFFIFLFFIISCNNAKVTDLEASEEYFYKNHHDSVQYVGKETCKQCHLEIYNSFMQTGMGKSFSHATKKKISIR
tara:strand:- start:217 stop:450 length:234 start_codon:yes stop_codon:yes gene_type:complete